MLYVDSKLRLCDVFLPGLLNRVPEKGMVAGYPNEPQNLDVWGWCGSDPPWEHSELGGEISGALGQTVTEMRMACRCPVFSWMVHFLVFPTTMDD